MLIMSFVDEVGLPMFVGADVIFRVMCVDGGWGGGGSGGEAVSGLNFSKNIYERHEKRRFILHTPLSWFKNYSTMTKQKLRAVRK